MHFEEVAKFHFEYERASFYRTRAIGVEQLAEDLVRLLNGGKKVKGDGIFQPD